MIKFIYKKKGRKWAQIEVEGKNYPYKAKTAMENVENMEIGESRKVFGKIEDQGNRYGSDYVLVIMDQESYKAERTAELWKAISEGFAKNIVYDKSIQELRSLKVTDYDDVISTETNRIEVDRWWGYIQDAYKKGYIYEKGVSKLHELGCKSYDSEIEEKRKQLAEEKKREKAELAEKKRMQEEDEHIIHLAIGADRGGSYFRPGNKRIYKDKYIEVIRSKYCDADGWSFGAMCEEWYSVTAKDLSETPEGKKALEEWKEEREKKRIIAEAETAEKNAIRALKDAIRDKRSEFEADESTELAEIIFEGRGSDRDKIGVTADGMYVVYQYYIAADMYETFYFGCRKESVEELINAYQASRRKVEEANGKHKEQLEEESFISAMVEDSKFIRD